MSPADEQRLQAVYRRGNRSMLQYAREASPYTPLADRKLLAAMKRIAAEEADALEAFAAFLDGRRVPLPFPGSFPMAFTDLNFVTIRSLLPKLVAEQKADRGTLDADREAVGDTAAKAQLQLLVELHRRHLSELEAIG